jgi:hypothetical protein
MVMRWLTRDWHGSGGNPLDDAQVAERTAAYARHRETVIRRRPDDLKALAGEPGRGRHWDLHDGRVEAWEARTPERFVLYVVSGDVRCGYQRLQIEYRNPELFGATEQELAAWFGDARTELLYQEVDALPDGRFEHRHLLWPEGEFGIRFGDISVTATAATASDYTRAKRPASSR